MSNHDNDRLPLSGRTALVTGVSRRAGIGLAVVRRLAGLGAEVFLHHYAPHDAEQPYGADPQGPPVDGHRHLGLDLADPEAPARLMAAAREGAPGGQVDILVCNHAQSGHDGTLDRISAADLDLHWAVDTRSSLLLAQAFAAQYEDGPRPGAGRVLLLTSGQLLGPMPEELAYATAKGALAAVTPTLADHLADRGITVNCVNPGPVDTGYASPEAHELVRRRFPAGRWGEPDDPARLIAWLATDDARWITGQVISSEGGFRR
ncbi:SDR family oxidoreductase [Phaeacidiphilus oryzae]|uniref:SDR family oxidoreductase n=1 Tax=Phaeacidiphilus oryzae TaxID=348818 RepID=UPI00056B528E|nr:SDR family oxidoreductase [Phaeacidiphilus oryzae]